MNDLNQVVAEPKLDQSITMLDFGILIVERWKLLLVAPLLAALLVLSISFLMPHIYTAQTSFLPPQQQQSSGLSALASLGSLAGLAGASGLRSPADQYVALLQSVNIEDRLIERFKLDEVYEERYRSRTRKTLESRTRINLGKKEGIITIAVEDRDPTRAAAIANAYVDELRRLTSQLALTEAQQRRQFFENHLKSTRDKLVIAQQSLQSSGFSVGALQAEPKAAAEQFARLRAEATAAEVRLQGLRRGLTDNSPEVLNQQSALDALRRELSKLEAGVRASAGPDYISNYREFKYQETLFEMFSRQYELARLDESKEGAFIQTVDVAAVPDYKTWPRRGFITALAFFLTLTLLIFGLIGQEIWYRSELDPANTDRLQRLRSALRG